MLYNLNDITDDSAYIVVGDTTSYWRENKLFIFDDTLLLPVLQRDRPDALLPVRRHRPADAVPALMKAVVTAVRLLSESFKSVYYKHWKVIDR